ncbi:MULTISPECIES: hypothetical protein [Streptomyces]|uniref:hypothetical protein n=1 Tax=Streptomyces TaxID=1883 RepID=UPI001F22DDF3|nr:MULTISPECIES: hypothetical protein [Streptomyces]
MAKVLPAPSTRYVDGKAYATKIDAWCRAGVVVSVAGGGLLDGIGEGEEQLFDRGRVIDACVDGLDDGAEVL